MLITFLSSYISKKLSKSKYKIRYYSKNVKSAFLLKTFKNNYADL